MSGTCHIFSPPYALPTFPRYFSYGAAVEPSIWSAFRLSHRVLAEIEGPNDGLVSVSSSRWGGDAGYKGTLKGVSHLDLINWTNRLKWLVGEVTGNKRKLVDCRLYFGNHADLYAGLTPLRFTWILQVCVTV